MLVVDAVRPLGGEERGCVGGEGADARGDQACKWGNRYGCGGFGGYGKVR